MPYDPTNEQQAIIAHNPERHARVLAGPGTGTDFEAVAMRFRLWRGVATTARGWGSPPYPRTLGLFFVEHFPVTVQLFRRTMGTRYSRFISEEALVHLLWSMRDEMLKAQKESQRVHLRFVH